MSPLPTDANESKPRVTRAYATIPEGQMHYRVQGSGRTILLLHMACSSSDEFTRLIPLLSKEYRAIAPDHLGSGESDPPPRVYEVPEYATSIVSFMDALDIRKAVVLGHHVAAQIAVEMAVTHPDRVEALILSGLPCSRDPAERLAKLNQPYMQPVNVKADGSHLMEYWARANRFRELNHVVNERALDYFKGGVRGEELHWAAAKYHVLPKLTGIACPTLLICGSSDWMMAGSDLAREMLPESESAIVEGGNVLMYRAMPDRVAAPILSFLRNR